MVDENCRSRGKRRAKRACRKIRRAEHERRTRRRVTEAAVDSELC